MTTYQLLKQAIKEKKQVIAVYDGKPREICPHSIGRTKAGVENCVAYQFGGQSSKPLSADGDAANWRCMSVAKFSSVKPQGGAWHTGERKTGQPQDCIDVVDVEVSR